MNGSMTGKYDGKYGQATLVCCVFDRKRKCKARLSFVMYGQTNSKVR